MSYIALYRKYRPLTFEDMVGQSHVTKILKNQIETGKVSHAYIFSGTRGTGKTTAAKAFARAINCLNPKEGEPCNECEACKSILEGNTTDVVEMDAASNNSVDNIRSIRQEVAYSTTGLKYKVYIIDEAHMLSASAFNALLKTLEEPPKNVVFILATTEEHKILPTILSRCIRFEFKKIGKEHIVGRLEKVLRDLEVEYELEALERIAFLADGGMRDALSILERCINSANGKITKAKVEEIVGTVPSELIEVLVANILAYNVSNVSEIVNEILNTGKDLRNITSSVIDKYLEILVAISTDNTSELAESIKGVINSSSITRIHQIIKHISKLDDDIRQSTNGNILFKAKMLELATRVVSLDENELVAKIQELEMKIEKLEQGQTFVSQAKPKEVKKVEQKVVSEVKEDTKVEQVKEVKIAEVKTSKKVLKELNSIMQKAVDMDNLKLYSALAGTEAYTEGEDTVLFSTKNAFAYGVLNKDNSKEDLKKIVEQELDKEFNIKIEFIGEEKKETNSFEQMMQGTDVPFEVID